MNQRLRVRFRVRAILVAMAVVSLLLFTIAVPIANDFSRSKVSKRMAERVRGLGGVVGLSYDIIEKDGLLSTLRSMVLGADSAVSLSSIDFSGVDLTEEHMLLLREIKEIEVLDLSDTKMRDEYIANLRGIHDLRVINLKHTQITPDGIEQLKELFPDATIYY